MADQRKRLSELPTSTSTDGLYTLGVDSQNNGMKIPFGDLFNNIKKSTTDTKGQPNGLAPLDADAQVPEKHLPDAAIDVVRFGWFVDDVATETAASDKTSHEASVVYDQKRNRFLLTSGGFYYKNWADAHRFGLPFSDGVRPYAHKTYTLKEANGNRRFYYWNGVTLDGITPYTPAIATFDWLVDSTETLADGSAKYVIHSGTLTQSITESGAHVVYDIARNRFMRQCVDVNGKLALYTLWREFETFGTAVNTGNHTSGGIKPYDFKVYRNQAAINNNDTHNLHYSVWNGTKLAAPLSAYDVNAQLSSVVATYNSAILELRNTIDSLTERIEALEQTVASHTSHLQTIDGELINLDNNDVILSRDIASLNTDLSGQISRLKQTTDADLRDLNDDVTDLKTSVRTLTATVGTLDGVVSEMESANDVQDARLNEIEFTVTDPDTGLAKTTERVAALETRFADGVLLL